MKPAMKILAVLLLGYASGVSSNEVPEAFADLFVETEDAVEIVLSGELKGHKVDAKVSYDKFTLLDKNNIKTELVKYFKSHKLKQIYIDKALVELLAGVVSNQDCINDSDICIPRDVANTIEYHYDYDNKILNVFASSDMFDFNLDEKQYHSSERPHNAIINNTNLYVYVNDDDSSLTWSNDTTIGLPKGYLDLDTQYILDENKLDTHAVRYNYDLSSYLLSIGYSDTFADQRINSTDYLYYGVESQGYSALLASSKNLLVKDGYSQHFLNFYSPQAGQLEVYRNGKLLFTDIAKQGRNQISYNELPQGIYAVTIKVKQGDSIIVEENIQVVNKNSIALNVEELDFLIQAGVLESDDVMNGGIEYSTDNKLFSEIALAYRPTENLQIGGAIGTDFDSARLSLGSQYYFSDDFSIQYVGSASSAGGLYNQSTARYGALAINLLDYNASDVDYRYRYVPYGQPSMSTYSTDYSNALYGNNDRTEYGISYSHRLLGGSAYINLYHSSLQLTDQTFESNNISLSWDRKLLGGTFGLNTTYSVNKNGDDDFLTNLSWRYKFDDTYSMRTSVSTNNDGFAFAQQEFTATKTHDDQVLSATVASKVESYGETPWSNELLLSGSGSNQYVNYSGFGYASTEEQFSVSGTLRGTQIVTKDEFVATKNDGKSFVKVTPEWTSVPTEDSAISYSIYKDGENRHTGEVDAQSEFITSIPVYSDVYVDLDTEYTDVEVDVSSVEHFSVPGSYLNVNSRVTPLKSQVFILNDIYGDNIENAQCAGSGCKSVEPVSGDGVYRVVYRENDNFHLIGDNAICVFNPAKFGSKYMQSFCLEGLEDATSYAFTESDGDHIETFYNGLTYMGVYRATKNTYEILERLQELEIESRFVEVGKHLYVYVKQIDSHTTAQTSTLNELNEYLVHKEFNSENMFSVTQL